MTTLKASNGRLLVRPTGRVLATSCDDGSGTHCSPCITTTQNAAATALAGGPCADFNTCGLVDMLPSSLRFCEGAEGTSWAGDCIWIWAEAVDISEWTAPDWVFNYVLILRVDTTGFSGELYCGSDLEDGDPCEWMVGAEPLFVWQSGNTNTITCGADSLLHGTIQMTGQDSGWGGANATGYTLTVSLP